MSAEVKKEADVLVIGGGLAGLTAAIHLSRLGYTVTVLEKDAYPHHKVCGEYISNEVLPYLQWLDADPAVLNPVAVTHLEFSMDSGPELFVKLPLGGFGVSRYRLDHYLSGRAQLQGSTIVQEQAASIVCQGARFEVWTASGNCYKAKVVVGAFGKRSSLDVAMKRGFIQKRSPWLAVKGHYRGTHPGHIVGLHCFDGGYCGVSRVEDGLINICYLVQYSSFKRYKNIEEHREQVLYKNPALRAVFAEASPVFEKPLAVSQLSFAPKPAVEQHILMTGDTAGLIHPLCGNGMAMAIHSAKIAAGQIALFLEGKITRAEMEQAYAQEWEHTFIRRMKTGRLIASLLQRRIWAAGITRGLKLFPQLLPALIRHTHGQPVTVPAYTQHHEAQKY